MTVFKSKTCRRKKRKDEMPDFEDAIKLIEYFDWRSDRLNNVIACLKYRADLSPPVPDDVAEISEDDLSVIIAEEISRNTIPVDYTEIGNAPAKAIAKYYPNGLKIIAEVEQVTVPSRAASTPSAEVQSKIDELRDNYSWIKKEKEVLALQKIPLSASTSGEYIAPDYIKGWNAAIDALNQPHGLKIVEGK